MVESSGKVTSSGTRWVSLSMALPRMTTPLPSEQASMGGGDINFGIIEVFGRSTFGESVSSSSSGSHEIASVQVSVSSTPFFSALFEVQTDFLLPSDQSGKFLDDLGL